MGEQTRLNAATLIGWFRKRKSPAGIKEIKASGLMDAQTASAAVGYAVRHQVLERVKAEDGHRWLYRLTGRPLPAEREPGDVMSFDSLLTAWGLPRVPLDLQVASCRRIEALC
ncbi:hypothetical protein FAZ69_08515 [Trinickia terrae]|uniref:Uncharacterized protein n=1 Tax=Trinickia terrae TaxID=2571161 RepID=A0A4V5PJX9_9BURK|nr:hypothetical protein [Trinickia terrae]TKC90180.1 hypothetical protein FAZ69_08515 [Trinickia terrae]